MVLILCCVVLIVLPREEELRNNPKPSLGGEGVSCRDKRRDGSRMASPRG